MRQAWMTASEYLQHAIVEIDKELGDGYAAKHPELITAFIQVAAMDFQTSSTFLAQQQNRECRQNESEAVYENS